MKDSIGAFLAGLLIGVISTMMLTAVGTYSNLVGIEKQYEIALESSYDAFDSLYVLYRETLKADGLPEEAEVE